MTDMIPPVGQSRFMLIHAPKQFMVLSTILTNRVNKRLRTVMPRTEKPATGSSRASQFSGLHQLAAGAHIVRTQPAGFKIFIFGQI
ncbi:hypothetical protein EM858_16535 [Agrobacterium sp. CNPSo 2736]|nr:hypothetical protein EM858_16535 [Agrobacterium sp. CNPSo 2736]TGE89388.1 hypothetical protein C9418_13870 [Rhizobium sp. SEMIA 4032]